MSELNKYDMHSLDMLMLTSIPRNMSDAEVGVYNDKWAHKGQAVEAFESPNSKSKKNNPGDKSWKVLQS